MKIKLKEFNKSEYFIHDGFITWVYNNFGLTGLICKQKNETEHLCLLYKPEEAKTIKRVSDYCKYNSADYETAKLLLCKCKKKNLFIGVGDSEISAKKEAIDKANIYYNKNHKEIN